MDGLLKSISEFFLIFAEDLYHDIVRKSPFKRKLNLLKDLNDKFDFIEIEHKCLSFDEISVQYNPDRFEAYKSVHIGTYERVLDIRHSPHCKLLHDYNNNGNTIWKKFRKHPYYRLQRRFGKSRRTALDKAKKLTALFDEIKANGFKGGITVIDKPLVANPYNQGYEIFDGHHRAACGIVLGMKKIEAIVLKTMPKKCC